MTDLFGADLPVEGGEAGQFVWRDGPLLKALKAGHWIVLDEVHFELTLFYPKEKNRCIHRKKKDKILV